jgi:hypothetical protein
MCKEASQEKALGDKHEITSHSPKQRVRYVYEDQTEHRVRPRTVG